MYLEILIRKIKRHIKISGTVGISFVPEHGTVFEELYKKADMALYYAKSKGKDRYELENNISDNNIKLADKCEKSKPVLKEILDSIDNYIYIVNPNTYELIFVNNKVSRLDLEIKLGETCYKSLLKSDRPCNNCPLNGLEGNKHSKFKIETNTFGKNISIASWINCIDDLKVKIVTTDFHVLRSKILAYRNGYKNTSFYASKSKLSFVPTYYTREFFALWKTIVFDR
ncbi:diguanylate cyclase [Clostridioides difficile]|uniref:diguanylate cyclase domain-containing protein n=1 Tax=Clostridioides difficile TaxID=1496 RepID=UPI001F20835C|nr:diguanylate cyclase [Clostridioides difficile]MCK3748036.1 diguanylate cyclase [Clostridioides difficile]MCP8416716.1 diguanylate cyclase [Clostridioides difficile]MCP8493886.1 diguanylate cyclase [Clostridioides difficile]MCP8665362.1 diguanylate cyclase [Clostridioides difficile]